MNSCVDGLLPSPLGTFVDQDGNVWVTDCACTGTAQQRQTPGKGHQVYKFSPDGTLLLTLGKAGGAREPDYFYQPNDVLVAPDGSIFVAEGHSSAATANARVLKFAPDGRLLKAFGTKATGSGGMDQPHALGMASRGRLFVGDRSNNRILIMDRSEEHTSE